MKSRALTYIAGMALFAALTIPARLAAQEQTTGKHHAKHHRFKFVDLGTFGGPVSYFSAAGNGARVLNNRGAVAGYADTTTPDPFGPNNCFNFDCFLSHAFRWQNGVLTDLGAFPGVNSSAVSAINERGWVAGFSQNGVIDPLTGTVENDAVLWKNREPINLGTLGGNESLAIAVNNRGQVTGIATNTIPDSFPGPLGLLGTQQHTSCGNME